MLSEKYQQEQIKLEEQLETLRGKLDSSEQDKQCRVFLSFRSNLYAFADDFVVFVRIVSSISRCSIPFAYFRLKFDVSVTWYGYFTFSVIVGYRFLSVTISTVSAVVAFDGILLIN